eukprot:1428341-Pyramimonas_sp.AAC.1
MKEFTHVKDLSLTGSGGAEIGAGEKKSRTLNTAGGGQRPPCRPLSSGAKTNNWANGVAQAKSDDRETSNDDEQ